MSLDPLGRFVEQSHLLHLLFILFLHYSDYLITFLPLFLPLLELIGQQFELMVHILIGLLGLLLSPGLTVHIDVVVGKVIGVLAVVFLMLLVKVRLVRLVLGPDLSQVRVESIYLLLKQSDLFLVTVLQRLVIGTRDVVELLKFLLLAGILATDCGLQILNLKLTGLLGLLSLLFIFLKVLFLLVSDLSKLLGSRLQNAELFLD